jgi:hypothetical protein
MDMLFPGFNTNKLCSSGMDTLFPGRSLQDVFISVDMLFFWLVLKQDMLL